MFVGGSYEVEIKNGDDGFGWMEILSNEDDISIFFKELNVNILWSNEKSFYTSTFAYGSEGEGRFPEIKPTVEVSGGDIDFKANVSTNGSVDAKVSVAGSVTGGVNVSGIMACEGAWEGLGGGAYEGAAEGDMAGESEAAADLMGDALGSVGQDGTCESSEGHYSAPSVKAQFPAFTEDIYTEGTGNCATQKLFRFLSGVCWLMIVPNWENPSISWVSKRGFVERYGVIDTCFITKRRSGKLTSKMLNLAPGFRVCLLFLINENASLKRDDILIRVRGVWRGIIQR
jgi:hypothetical protein